MGVYIKGMEMPTEDEEIIIRISSDGMVMTEYALPITWAKAVPVPSHGRLIDADALKEAFCGNCFADEKPMECSEPCMDMRIILETPTIIQASEEGR